MRRFLFWLSLCALPLPVWSQNNATDSQNLRALLEEVRHLRQDLRAATLTGERVQIVLYRLQLQDAAVARAAKLVDDAKDRLARVAAERQRVAADMQRADDLRRRSQDAHELRVIEEEALPQMKRHAEQLADEEQHWQAQAGEAEAQLRTEQAKLDSLHNTLDQLEQALENMAAKSGSAPPAK